MDSLPKSLERILIQNRDSRDPIHVELPEDIGKFQNLTNILTDNITFSKVPDSICNLKNLNFLAITRNPELTTIPDCVADLPNLMFLNLKGCDNVRIPKKIEEKGDPIGPNMWDLEYMDKSED
jgi:Leucine-rich repeat (LRR) protein